MVRFDGSLSRFLEEREKKVGWEIEEGKIDVRKMPRIKTPFIKISKKEGTFLTQEQHYEVMRKIIAKERSFRKKIRTLKVKQQESR